MLPTASPCGPPDRRCAGRRVAPGAAAGRRRRDMTLGPVVYATLPSCDNPTPVRAPDGAVYSNVSDCSVGGRRVSTGWVRVFPSTRLVPSGLTTSGDGAHGLKLSGALVEGGTLYLLERNLTRSGGMRLGRSASVAQPRVTWTGTLDFGWGSFAQASPDGYEYVYLRDSRTAYGTADRVDLARVPKGRVADLAAWEVFAGSPAAPRLGAVGEPRRAQARPDRPRPDQPPARQPPRRVLDDGRHHAAPSRHHGRERARGLHVARPYGPWNRRYYVAGVNLGESAQFSPIWPGRLLLSEGDRFEWRRYAMPGGC